MKSRIVIACLALLGLAAPALAQAVAPPDEPGPARPNPFSRTPGLFAAVAPAPSADPALLRAYLAGQTPDKYAGQRACDGCPPRGVGQAIWQATFINVAYGLANLVRGQETAKVTPATWWDNMEQGWVWDLDDFLVNQIGHPYQGNNYFNAGRSNGLSFYESAAVAAFGSATWEYFGETNHASLNDFINTTLGGIALGEMFHRAGWLVRNTRATGKGRLWSEIGATALDPITGLNRFITGDASRLSDKPAEFIPPHLDGNVSAGVLWRGSQTRAVESSGDPFVEIDLLYGDALKGKSRTPYDAFGVRLRFGGGGGLSEAKVRGRLLGAPLKGEKLQFSVLQSYDFQSNDVYSTGSQSFEGSLGFTQNLSKHNSLWLMGWGGLTVLGAVDSLPVDLNERPDEPVDPDAPQGVSEGPRYYDYGPGGNLGASAALRRDGRALLAFTYEGRHLYSLDGVRANHFLQRSRLDVLLPLRGRLGVGGSGEYFIRNTYYQDAARTVKKFHYPQLRAYFTWRLS